MKKATLPVKNKGNDDVYDWVKSIIYDRESSALISTNKKTIFVLTLDERVTETLDIEFANSEVKQYYCDYNAKTYSLIFRGDGPGDTELGEFDYLEKLPDLDDYSEFSFKNHEGVTKNLFEFSNSNFNFIAPSLINLLEYPINLEFLKQLIGGKYIVYTDLFGDYTSQVVFEEGAFRAFITPFRIT